MTRRGLCGEEIHPDFEHRCQRITLVGPARPEFPWAGWNAMIWCALALAAVIGGAAGYLLDRWTGG